MLCAILDISPVKKMSTKEFLKILLESEIITEKDWGKIIEYNWLTKSQTELILNSKKKLCSNCMHIKFERLGAEEISEY